MFLPTAGYLMVSIANTRVYTPSLDVSATEDPGWQDNFSQTQGIGSFRYTLNTSGAADTGLWDGALIPFRPLGFTFYLRGWCNWWQGDDVSMDWEFFDSSNNVVAALRIRKDGELRSGLWYGPSLNSLTKTAQRGAYPNTAGDVKINADGIVFTHQTLTDGENQSFSFPCNMASVVAMRFTNLRGKSTYTSAGSPVGGCHLKIKVAPPVPDGELAGITTEQFNALNYPVVLPAGAAIAHQTGVGVTATGSAPAYLGASGVLPGQTGVWLDGAAVLARLTYLNGVASLTVQGETVSAVTDVPFLYMTVLNTQLLACSGDKVILRSPKFGTTALGDSYVEIAPGQSVARVITSFNFILPQLAVLALKHPCTAIPANQEPRSQFQPQDVAWRGTPPMYAGPVNLRQQTQYPLCKGRDYYWIRDGVRNVEQGYIESTVTISGVGVRRRVLCFTQDGELVGETYSRASDGVYRFDLLWLNKRYMLVAQDDPAFGPADYNAVAADYQAPKPYPPGGGVAPAPFPMLAPLKRK